MGSRKKPLRRLATRVRFGDGVEGRRPPADQSDVRSAYSSATGQHGHVAVDPGRRDAPATAPTCGIHRGVVVATEDPEGRGRLCVTVGSAPGTAAAWALPCVPPGGIARPAAGQTVWIVFEEGDPTRPVWIGVFPAPGIP
jgi:hypothetical protein